MAAKPPTLAECIGVTPLALGQRDAARAIGISDRLLWQLTRDGKVPHLRLGRRVIYPVADLQRWLAEEAAKAVRP